MKHSPTKILVMYMPVIHRGYLDLLQKYHDLVDVIYVIDLTLAKTLSRFEPDIAALNTNRAVDVLRGLGYTSVFALTESMLGKLANQHILLTNDEVGRNLAERLNPIQPNIEWVTAFLRWDRAKVLSEDPVGAPSSTNPNDRKWMQLAERESQKSSDWWRQVGAVVVRNGQLLLSAYNQGVPSDHTSYLHGGIRDFLEVSERPEIAGTIHAEQWIVAQAAQMAGISLTGSTWYITDFPCPVCAKLIILSGAKRCCFARGSAKADSWMTLRAAGVETVRVEID